MGIMLPERWQLMIVSVFGDESAAETKQRAFSVSGIVGEERDWQSTEKLWLEQTRGEEFHAADWEHEKRHPEYKALTQILCGSTLWGVTSALDLHAFREILGETIEEVGYFKCLSDILSNSQVSLLCINRGMI